MSENGAKNSESTTNRVNNDEDEKNNKTNTLKNVKRKLRKFTFRKQKPQINVEEKSDKMDNSGDEEAEKGKFTLKKIFRKSSFRKIITNLQQFTNFTPTNAKNDRVPPLNNYVWPADSVPGVMGIRNHGNTCFMNAVLQCLSHTDILAEYFVLDQYKADLRKRNKINSRKYGTKGELTEQLALVLKALWTCKDPSEYSTTFKEVVERYGSQFRSSTQHDAQEFLLWLLDKVHEDLNTATKRKYKTIKNNYGRPDAVIAAETLANYMRCNNSFVQAVFRAQFRSSLTCPRCEKQSNTFDPFHCISVQLPQLTQQTVDVDVIYDVKTPKQVRMSINIPQGSSVLALREQLHTDTQIDIKRMVLTECSSSGFGRLFCDSHPLSNIERDDRVMCIELPDKIEDSQVAVCFVNVHKSEEKSNRFGSVFCMKLNRDVSFAELQKALLKQMSAVLKPETFSYSTPLSEMFKIHLQEPSADPNTYLESKFEHPLMTEMIDLALSVHPSDSGPAHIKFCLEWTEPEKFFADMEEHFVEDESINKNKEKSDENSILTLQQCLDHYTKAETLSAEDAWRCPHCREYLPVVKTLGLWSLPDILVIHFKRFRQQQLKGSQASKLTTMVTFPLNELDMLPWYLSNNNNNNANNTSTTNSFGSLSRKSNSLKPSSKSGTLTKSTIPDDHRYDLYAVCYHQGDTLETGHYTAACKNPYDQQWYKFDDQRVTLIKNETVPDAIINNEAYMLFYQRRKASDCESSCASTSSSEHWVSRIPIPPSTNTSNNTSVKSEEKVENKTIEEVKNEAKPEPIAVETAPEPEKKDLTSVLADIDDIKPIDSDDIPEVEEKAPSINEEVVVEPPKEEIVVNGHSCEEKEPEITDDHEDDDDDKLVEKKIEVKVEISACSPPPELASEIDDVVHNDLLRREGKNSKSQDFMSHKINNLLWGDQNNNNNRHSDIGGITISDLLLMDRIEDISSTSLPKNYMLHDTERITSRIRSVSSCSKDTLLYIDQQSLLDDESLLDNRSHWISPVTPHKLSLVTVSPKN